MAIEKEGGVLVAFCDTPKCKSVCTLESAKDIRQAASVIRNLGWIIRRNKFVRSEWEHICTGCQETTVEVKHSGYE